MAGCQVKTKCPVCMQQRKMHPNSFGDGWTGSQRSLKACNPPVPLASQTDLLWPQPVNASNHALGTAPTTHSRMQAPPCPIKQSSCPHGRARERTRAGLRLRGVNKP
jgi:hypothetical protein